MRHYPARLNRKILSILLWGLVSSFSTAVAELIPIGPGGGNISAMAMDPSDPSILYAMNDKGLFRSENSGTSWAWVSRSGGGCCGYFLAVDPARPWKVCAGSTDFLERSDDRGHTWTEISNPRLFGLNGLSVAPGRPSTLFATTLGSVLRSRDEGRSWEALPFEPLSPRSPVVHPLQPQTLYLLSGENAHKSGDGGQTWSALLPPGSGTPSALALAPSQPETVYVALWDAIFRSQDGGQTWERLRRNARPGAWIRQLAVAPDDPETVYAATDHGVRVSRDGCLSWISASFGLPTGPEGVLRVVSILVDHQRPQALYAGIFPESPSGEPGVAKSWNGGRRWQLGLQRGLTAAQVLLRLDRTAPGAMYALAGYSGGWPAYVRGFRSLDQGRRWAPFSLPPGGASDLQPFFGSVYVGNEGGIWRTRDEGRTWQRLDREPSRLLAVVGRGTILAAASGTIRRSADQGRTWRVAYRSGEPGREIDELIVEPSDSGRVYAQTINFAGTGSTLVILRSEDTGATWHPFLEEARAMAIAPSDPRVIYVFQRGSLQRSDDRGATWDVVSHEATALALAVDRWDPDTLYAASKVILRSTDAGRTWETLDDRFADVDQFFFRNLTSSPWTQGKLYAWGVGLFELRD